MTPTQDKGFVDYVLFGENGKPLAVVEAKKAAPAPAAEEGVAEASVSLETKPEE